MTFNDLLELDKKAEHTEEAPSTPKKPKAPQVPMGSGTPVPSPASTRPKPKAKPIATKHDIERGITTPATVKGIRKAVKQPGKEAGN